MKTKQLFSTLVTGAFSLCCAMQAHAQNAVNQLNGASNASLDYMAATDQYLLSGTAHPPTIGPWSNAAPFGFLPRIQLQVFDNATLNTSLYKTYVTGAELSAVQHKVCSTLSVAFYQADAKQTSDGGFILCGNVFQGGGEFTTCPANQYSNPYLLKTNAAGMVTWYKRYDANYGSGTQFRSVIEDAVTGNFVVCGVTTPGPGMLPTAFMMGTDPMGNTIWAHNTMTVDGGGAPTTSAYSEITPYTDIRTGNKYMVLTGTVEHDDFYGGITSYAGIHTGGGLLTVINSNGGVINNVYITEDPYNRCMQLKGINDAYDGDVVLTGFSGAYDCAVHDGDNLLIMKINPLTLVTSFMRVYETNQADMYDQSYGYSIIAQNGGAGYIAVAADENNGGNGIYTEVDYSGNVLRYVAYTPGNVTQDVAVVYNSTNGYSAHTGDWAGGTSLIRNNYGIDCDPNQTPVVTDLVHTIVNNTTTDPGVLIIPDVLISFALPPSESIICGVAKPGNNTAPVKNAVSVANITLSPNPAENYIDVQLPDALKSGVIKVYDMTGRLVLTQGDAAATGTVRLQVPALANGVYMLTAENNEVKQHATFVKQ